MIALLILFVIVWIIISVVWAGIHSDIISAGDNPGGISDLLLRAFFAWAVIFIQLIVLYRGNIPYETGWRQFIALNIVYAGVFWLVFDISLNRFRHLPASYVSSTNGKPTDTFFHKFPNPFATQLLSKIIVIVSGIILFL